MLPYEWHGSVSAPPLLLLTGLGAKGTSFHPFLETAMERYRVLTPDLRGCGRAPALVPGATLGDLAADVLDLLQTLGVGPISVVGRSMGGMVAQELALRAPHGVIDRMVLASTTAYSDTHLSEIFRLLAHMTEAGVPAELRHRTSLLWAIGPVALEERETLRNYLDARIKNDRPLDYAIQALACAAHDTRPKLGSIRVPTLVLAGTDDRFMPTHHALTLARGIPRAELCFVPGAGHLTYMESPERFASEVFTFLSKPVERVRRSPRRRPAIRGLEKSIELKRESSDVRAI